MQRRMMVMVALLMVAVAAIAPGATMAEERPNINPPQVVVNQQTEIRPDLGPRIEGLTPGVDGYKSYGPGAIAKVQTQPQRTSASTQAVAAGTSRYGNTDAYPVSFSGIRADHSSTSEMREDWIRVEGTLAREGGPVASRNADTNYGSYATDPVQTSMSGVKNIRYRADSYHDYRKSGFTDTPLRTWDFATAT